MLKALELVGFKSFADKTRFEFPRGITAVVGPNGSGKSNVVDAIKWVLGEQSVKSLRGKEMVDVIFNGASGRPPLNAAETTLTLDNSHRLLALDTPEVHITRRVYRSGEGEYLINRQPCRLRDIRELFRGTGVATEAYSVIEQGKVDVLLQSSPRDRRMIFEEAAGISRFKAKKIESLRRLERVEQNLLRLSDIVSEVEHRLKAVRQQASKARRYREHADRLQELRTQVGLADWRRLSARLATLETEAAAVESERASVAAQAEWLEAEALAGEQALAELAETRRDAESQAAQVRERLAGQEATIAHERHRVRDLDELITRHRQQLASMDFDAGDLREQLQQTTAALTQAEERHGEHAARLADHDRRQAAFDAELERLRAVVAHTRDEHLQATRAAAALTHEMRAHEARSEATTATIVRARSRIADCESRRQPLADEIDQLRLARDEGARAAEELQAEIAEVAARRGELRKQHAARASDLGVLRQRHAAATERAAVLHELECRFEGLGAGVKEVLVQARHASEGPYRHVRGLLADLVRTSVEHAPLVDLALGERAQLLVVDAEADWNGMFDRGSKAMAGRVGFIRLARAGDERPPAIDLTGQPGVVNRADRLIDASPALVPLVQRLLATTWIVETLAQAQALATNEGRGLTLITLAGEQITPDGAVCIGSRQAAAGLVSRRSELRSLKQAIRDLEHALAQSASALLQLEQQIGGEERRSEELAARQRETLAQLQDNRFRASAAEAEMARLAEQHGAAMLELAAAETQASASATAHQTASEALRRAEAQLATNDATSAAAVEESAELARQRAAGETAAVEDKVALAKSEERLSALRARMAQCQRDQQQRDRAMQDGRRELEQAVARHRQAERGILHAETQTSELYLQRENLARQIRGLAERCDTVQQQRATLAGQAQRARQAVRKLEDQQRAQELATHELRLERTTLAERMRDDYDIDLATITEPPTAEALLAREQVEQEIAELRRKIQHLGNVNLDALAELDELETRFTSLSAQFEDLSKAKALLEQIIQKINADSRRLFMETLERVRENFQTLFRKLFGGGQADIVLEPGVDVLDSGIEIVARPPGKEPRNISLLSGGEKTLTCVALLLAVFQYRPSPFCVLDEVDAALDEANIERFVTVLQEFLAWTQFIVVTHSKKTMTCATTLYGVTMQESGVSKRVSVRFEDVSETGEIREAASQQPPDETQAA